MPINGSVAPVCPISRSQAVPGMPGLRIPSVPLVQDLSSAIQALNQIAAIIPQLTTPVPLNNVFPSQDFPLLRGNSGPTQDGGGNFTEKRKQNWTEVGRDRETVRVTNPDDDSQWIEIDRIIHLEYRANKDGSGNTLVWNHYP